MLIARHRHSTRLVRLAASLALAATVSAAADDAIVDGPVGEQIDRYLTDAIPFGMHASVLVQIDDDVVIHKGYGLADRATGTTIQPGTIFDVGSVSKQFAAAAILKLQSQGRLHVDDALSSVFEDVPDAASRITIHHVLTHTSGIARSVNLDGVDMSDRDAVVERVLAQPSEHAPGAKFMYSNIGYGLAAAIVEAVSGQSYESFLRDELFSPAGLGSIGFGGDAALDRALVAHSYREAEDIGSALDWPYNWGFRGATGVLSTTGELNRWMNALLNGTILPEAELETLLEPERDNYACGWFVHEFETGRIARHTGSTQGFEALVHDLKRTDSFDYRMIILCNEPGLRDIVEGAVTGIVNGVAIAMPPTAGDLSDEQFEALTGTYGLASGGRLLVSRDTALLQLAGEGQDAIDALYSPLFGMDEHYQNARDHSREVILALMEGQFAPLRAVMPRDKPPSWPMQLASQLHRQANQHGGFEGLTIVGVCAQPSAAFRTAVRLDYAEGGETICLDWFGDELHEVLFEEAYAARALVVMETPATGASYDLEYGDGVSIRFDIGPDGIARSMTIHYLGTETTFER